jgi:UDP-N-acetyl-D-glucosamine dehydrogenase
VNPLFEGEMAMTQGVERFRGTDITFGVVGMGYVGLPLAVEVGKAGIRVIGLEVKPEVVEGVNQGRSHIQDVAHQEVAELRDAGLLEATTDPARMAECDVVSICVPTPLGKTRDPDVSYILQAGQEIARVLRPGQLVVLESTTYPGTTRDVLLPALPGKGIPGGEGLLPLLLSGAGGPREPSVADPQHPQGHRRDHPAVPRGGRGGLPTLHR